MKLDFKTICVFGDSISWGKGDYELGGWVNRLKIAISKQNPMAEVLDVSVPGDATRELLRRFDVEAKARKPDIIILAIGVNDSHYLGTPEKRRVDFAEFENNYRELIKKGQSYTDKLILVGLSGVDESKTKPIYGATKSFYTNADVARYDKKIQQLAAESNLPYVAVLPKVLPEHLPDGLHINAAGHELIKNAVMECLVGRYGEFLKIAKTAI